MENCVDTGSCRYRLARNEKITLFLAIVCENKEENRRKFYIDGRRGDADVFLDILPDNEIPEKYRDYLYKVKLYTGEGVIEGYLSKMMEGIIVINNYSALFDGRYNYSKTEHG